MNLAAAAWALLALWFARPALGVQVIGADVQHLDESYHIAFAVEIEAEPDQVWYLVTDFANLARLSSTIVESRLLSRGSGTAASRVEVTLRPCVWLIFCRTVRKVTDATLEGRSVVHVTVAELSDFHSARERLTVEPAARPHHSRVSYRATLVPKFFVPPLIGPYAMRKQILKDLIVTAERVEELAKTGAVGK